MLSRAKLTYRDSEKGNDRPSFLCIFGMILSHATAKSWRRVTVALGRPLYSTKYGSAHIGDSLDLLDQLETDSIDLVVTSPPFALQREKSYGNVAQEAYVNWLLEFCKKVYCVLAPTGSFVIDLGGAYQSKRPVRSLYNYHILIRLCEELDFRLAEEFFRPSGRLYEKTAASLLTIECSYADM